MPSRSNSSQEKKRVTPQIEPLIHTIRGQKVILDSDLASVYGVLTKVLNQAVKRNRKKFPDDFLFRLTAKEVEALRSQFVTSKQGKGGRRYLPYAFTEQGAIMAANVLNSSSAVRMSVFVVRAFLEMRRILSGSYELAQQLADLEKKLTERLDVHETAIVDILRRIMELIDPPPPPAPPPKPSIGFRVDGVSR